MTKIFFYVWPAITFAGPLFLLGCPLIICLLVLGAVLLLDQKIIQSLTTIKNNESNQSPQQLNSFSIH